MTTGNVTRQEVMELMNKRKDLEKQLQDQLEILSIEGVGMEEPLVDREGYPRNDVDLYKVRKARNQVICLRNDLKALMDQIEKGLHNLHEQSREGIGLSVESVSIRPRETRTTFLKVDIVTPSSPAEAAGLRVGDEIAEFGTITAKNFDSLKAIGELVQNSKDQELPITVVRGESVRKLILIPRPWSGQGLLGCNIVPLESNLDR